MADEKFPHDALRAAGPHHKAIRRAAADMLHAVCAGRAVGGSAAGKHMLRALAGDGHAAHNAAGGDKLLPEDLAAGSHAALKHVH